MRFPKNFMLGPGADEAHQLSGAQPGRDRPLNRYGEDIRLLAQAELNTYRFSIEWARIEPEDGRFDEAEVEN